MSDYYCPEEISGVGKERVKLKKGFSGSNGTSAPRGRSQPTPRLACCIWASHADAGTDAHRASTTAEFTCALAEFECYNATGNFVLLKLMSKEADPDVGTLV